MTDCARWRRPSGSESRGAEPFAAWPCCWPRDSRSRPGETRFACGDKFVRVGRGARYQRGYVALHPASIVLYMGSGAAASGTLKGMEPALKAAGHKVVTVKADALAATLRDGKHDLVLADFADAPRIASEVKAAPNPPELLPVMKKPTPDAFAEPRRSGCAWSGTPATSTRS